MNLCKEQLRQPSGHVREQLLVPMLLISLALGGCAHWPSGADDRAAGNVAANGVQQARVVGDFDKAVLASLADALAQIRPPQRTTLQTRNNPDAYYDFLVGGLSQKGYGIQRVSADQGAHFLELERTPEIGSSDGDLVTYSLSVGAIELRRDFLVAPNARYRPMGALKVSGTRASMTIDDSQFQMSDEVRDHVSRVEYTAMSEAMDAMPIISLITDDVVAGIARSATGQSSGNTSLQALNSSKVEVSNLFFGSASAFGDLRNKMTKVTRQVVVFPNDSLRLGRSGKTQILIFLQQFQQGSDMIGLIGCSNGRTKLAIGNEGLALGRSERVTEELLSLGVPRDAILDEGCWAPRSAGERFPSRGVVMELLRRET